MLVPFSTKVVSASTRRMPMLPIEYKILGLWLSLPNLAIEQGARDEPQSE